MNEYIKRIAVIPYITKMDIPLFTIQLLVVYICCIVKQMRPKENCITN